MTPAIRTLRLAACLLLALIITGPASAQASAQTLPVLMLSDVHFDPFHDPAKAARLAAAPITGWDAILREPDSPDQADRFEELQQRCNARGVDSGYAVFNSTLRAAQARAKDVLFVTVTGDLLVHNPECRFKTVLGKDDPRDFIEKTANYVMLTFENAFPTIPVYIADGNNDSSCGDYHMDRDDRFLKATSHQLAAGFRDLRPLALKRALADYEAGGSYALTLTAPRKTRLIVLNDIFLSHNYQNCRHQPDEAAVKAQLAWLDHELRASRARGQAVWVIGHIPPGIDPYFTLAKFKNLCSTGDVTAFLESDRLVQLLERYTDIVRLGLFAHTHSDEIRLLEAPWAREGPAGRIPIKLVPSISPVNGNRPSFTLAQVDDRTAKLVDYEVFVASNSTGKAPTFSREYGFRQSYYEADFSTAAVNDLIHRLQSDRTGARRTSRAYESYFAPGMLPLLLLVWPQYTCALNHLTVESFKACACNR